MTIGSYYQSYFHPSPYENGSAASPYTGAGASPDKAAFLSTGKADNAKAVPGSPEDADNTKAVPGSPEDADNTKAVPGSPEDADNTKAVPGSPEDADDSRAGSDAVDKTEGDEECQTCKKRKYQDGSNENVSFKSARHISPESAASAVRAHEMEHVSNAYSQAEQNDGKVLNVSVRIHTAICPECGRTYVSGGVTNTMIQYPNESNPYQQERKSQDAIQLKGANADYAS